MSVPFQTLPIHNRLAPLCGISIVAMLITACQPPQETSLKPEKIAALAKPGVVFVLANHQAEITYAEPILDNDRLQQLHIEIGQRLSNGSIRSKAEAVTTMIKEVLGNPVQYMRPGRSREKQVKVSSTGTGFILTEDGHVLTAAHVVSREDKAMKRRISSTALEETTKDYCGKLLQRIASSADIQEALSQTTNRRELTTICENGFVDYHAKYLQIGQVATETTIVLPSTNPGQTNAPKVIPSEIKKVGQPVPGQDVAILKMTGQNFPTVELSDSSAPSTGSNVYSLGHPAAIAKQFIGEKSRDLPEPTLTAGIVSAENRAVEGGKVLQANIAISPGNSGGPLFDTQAKVVGLASFVALNEEGQPVEGAGFFVPNTTLKSFAQEAGLTLKESKVMQLYRRGINFWHQKQFKRALKEFEEVRNLNPDFPYIQQLIAQAQTESNKDKGFLSLF